MEPPSPTSRTDSVLQSPTGMLEGDGLADSPRREGGGSEQEGDSLGPTTRHKWAPVPFNSRSPGSRVFPSAVVHGDSLHIFGGHDGTSYRNDLVAFNLESQEWTLDLGVVGEGPSPRDAHAAVVHGEYMYVFGGYDSKRYLNDFHRYHFETAEWSVVPQESYRGSGPSPRGGHTAVVYEDAMVVFGGCDGWNYFNDCYRHSFAQREWTALRVTGTAPGARSAPATVVREATGEMFVFGGYDGARSLNDLFRFALITNEWSHVRVSGTPPSPRGGHTAVVHDETMYIFGGKSGRSPFNDLYGFSFERSFWERVQVGPGAPSPRCAHVCVPYSRSLFVLGGYDGRRYFEDCFELAVESSSPAAVLSLAGDLEGMLDNEQALLSHPVPAPAPAPVPVPVPVPAPPRPAPSCPTPPSRPVLQFSDVRFEVAGRTVHAHRFILFARCEYFRRMFTGGYREARDECIPIPDVRYDVFLCVLAFLYTGKPREMAPEMAIEVMGAANLYGIEPLKRMCADIVTRGVTVQNAACILQAADAYQASPLRAACLSFMTTHFAAVVRTDAFKDLIRSETRGLVLAFLEEASARLTLAVD